jgi:cell division FtsZ-interacting protein ZapD
MALVPDRVEVHVYHHLAGENRLDTIEQLLRQVLRMEAMEMAELGRLTSEVAEGNDVQQSAITLLQNLSQLIRDNATDQTALNALADQLDSQNASLAAAVVANTPAAPNGGGAEEPPPEPNP